MSGKFASGGTTWSNLQRFVSFGEETNMCCIARDLLAEDVGWLCPLPFTSSSEGPSVTPIWNLALVLRLRTPTPPTRPPYHPRANVHRDVHAAKVQLQQATTNVNAVPEKTTSGFRRPFNNEPPTGHPAIASLPAHPIGAPWGWPTRRMANAMICLELIIIPRVEFGHAVWEGRICKP